MYTPPLALALFVAGAWNTATPAPVAGGPTAPVHPIAVEALGCAQCHALGAPGALVAPPREALGGLREGPLRAPFAAERPAHRGVGDVDARALAAFLRDVESEVPDPRFYPHALEIGRRLYHRIGCVACHGAQEESWERELSFFWTETEWLENQPAPNPTSAPPTQHGELGLENSAERFTPGGLQRYLLDPLEHRPSGDMPDFDLDPAEAEALAVYLVRDRALGNERRFRATPGLTWRRYDEPIGLLESFTAEGLGEPDAEGVWTNTIGLPEHPEDDFVFVFDGGLAVPREGSWEFALASDDGSRMFLDGRLVVDNDGIHPPNEERAIVRLAAGWHALRIEFFERGGGEELELRWRAQDGEWAPVPADAFGHLESSFEPEGAPTTAEVDRGRELFDRLACSLCHGDERAEVLPVADFAGGCLSETPPAAAPDYRFEAAERARLVAALAESSRRAARSPEERLGESLASLRCVSCHRRDGEGGPSEATEAYFVPNGDFDLGDEGRLPPHLDHVGAKLQPGALRAVLDGDGAVRPYLATRMPRFGDAATDSLPELFRQVDGLLPVPWDQRQASAPPAQLLTSGRQLAGTVDGLGCIQCHSFGDVPSLGIPAVDLLSMHARLEPGWFAQLLDDPTAVNLNTRMPIFWSDGKSPVALFDHQPGPQIEALWNYLSLGESAPLPRGLQGGDVEYELDATERPRIVSAFVKGVSPKTVLVGLPSGLNLAFDTRLSRLALAWRGRFFNARGTWEGRAGALEDPAGDAALELPAGPSWARLSSQGEAWPSAGPRRLGQRYESDGRPAFRYRLGACAIEERYEVDPAGQLVRRFELFSDERVEDLYLRLTTTAGPVPRASSPRSRLVALPGGELRLRVALIPKDGAFVNSVEVVYPW